MLWRVRIGHLKSQLRYSNSIMSKFAPPVPYSDEKHGRYLERAKSELTENDKAGKTPEEIIQLEKEMAIYIRNQEIQKVEIKRAQEDLGSMATITQGMGLFSKCNYALNEPTPCLRRLTGQLLDHRKQELDKNNNGSHTINVSFWIEWNTSQKISLSDL